MKRDLGDGYELDDAKARIDVSAVHRYIGGESYWARGRSYEKQEELVREASRVVGLYHHGEQVGFCRAVTDGASIVYLADVYVLEQHRGRGLGEELVREMVENGPYAESRWMLHTRDMHGLYRKFGFGEPSERVMERSAPGRQASRSTSQASDSG